MSFFIALGVAILAICAALVKTYKVGPFIEEPAEQPPTPPVEPEKPSEPAPVVEPQPKYLWDTPTNVRHSVRVICDEEELDWEQKNTLCATVGAESVGYNTKAINRNYIIRNGVKVLASTDWGLCQWNDYYHGHEISPDVALNDPETAVRLMCFYWKKGEIYRRWWIAYKNGSYRAYL